MNVTVREIADRLNDRAIEVCHALLPGGKDEGRHYVTGDLGGGKGKSFKVNIRPPFVGRWKEFAGGDEERGDLIDLYCAIQGCPLPEGVKWAKNYLGIRDPNVSDFVKKTYAKPSLNGEKPLDPQREAFKFLTETRGLSQKTIDQFKVMGCGEKKAIVFPRYSIKGELTNRSYRTLGADKKVWQDTGCAPCLYGWQAIDKQRAFDSRSILICEGDIDAMTWNQWGIDALSVPNGSGFTWIDFEWENLQAFDNIYLSFDMDEAGKSMLAKIIPRLGYHRCLLVNLPHKDANDCLLAGCKAQDASKWILEARTPAMDGIVTAEDLRPQFEEEMKPKPEYFSLPFLVRKPPEDGVFFRPCEVTIWSGPPHGGKTSLLNNLCMMVVACQQSIFIASLEVRPAKTLKRSFGAMLRNQEAIDQFFLYAGKRVIFSNTLGQIDQKTLFDQMRFAFRRYGVEHFVIDSLMRIKGLDEEYSEQGDFVAALCSFAQETGVHIHLVAHSRKLADGDTPSANTIKGSTLIHANADNVLTICRNPKKEELRLNDMLTPEKDRELHDTEVRCEKQRESGWTGFFKLKFNKFSLGFTEFKP